MPDTVLGKGWVRVLSPDSVQKQRDEPREKVMEDACCGSGVGEEQGTWGGWLLPFPAQALAEQGIVETYYVPVGIMGDAAINPVQKQHSSPLRNRTNRHEKLNDNTGNKILLETKVQEITE